MNAEGLCVEHVDLVEYPMAAKDSANCSGVLLEFVGNTFPVLIFLLAITGPCELPEDVVIVSRQLSEADVGNDAYGFLQCFEICLFELFGFELLGRQCGGGR